MRRRRRHPTDLHPGDVLDFWRVSEFRSGQLLRLSAEMKLPGRAWLQFEVGPTSSGARIRQTAIFEPVGLMGLAYWYGIYPLHALMFSGMIKRIAVKAVASK